jgi:hypothetical protein
VSEATGERRVLVVQIGSREPRGKARINHAPAEACRRAKPRKAQKRRKPRHKS